MPEILSADLLAHKKADLDEFIFVFGSLIYTREILQIIGSSDLKKESLSPQDLHVPLRILCKSAVKHARKPLYDDNNSKVLIAQSVFLHLSEHKYVEREGCL